MQTCLCMCVKGKKSCVSHAQNVFFILKSRVPLLQMATKQRRRAPLHASSHLLTETEAEHIVICLPSCLAARLAALKMPTVCHHLGSFLTYKHLSRGGLSRPGLGRAACKPCSLPTWTVHLLLLLLLGGGNAARNTQQATSD